MAGFEEKVVVITGSSGIGLGAALHLASEGVKVYVCGIDGPTNDTARQKASGLNLTVFRVDVSDPIRERKHAKREAARNLHLLADVSLDA